MEESLVSDDKELDDLSDENEKKNQNRQNSSRKLW